MMDRVGNFGGLDIFRFCIFGWDGRLYDNNIFFITIYELYSFRSQLFSMEKIAVLEIFTHGLFVILDE